MVMGKTTLGKKLMGVGMAATMAMTLVLGARPAVAAPDATATAKGTPATPNKLALTVGLASPLGELGFSYQRLVAPSFALETGFGVGMTGVQVAALPKLLFGTGNARLFIEAGPSATFSDRTGPGLWAAAEVGFESSFGAWTLGFGGGAGILVAGEVPVPICIDSCSTLKAGTWLPEIRLTVGRNF
jgi:hypothetical protein